jgi:hypothetical protein
LAEEAIERHQDKCGMWTTSTKVPVPHAWPAVADSVTAGFGIMDEHLWKNFIILSNGGSKRV